MKTALKVIGGLLGLVLVCGGGFFVWAKSAAAAKMERTFEVHQASFPIPFPLSEAEIAQLRKQRQAKKAAANAAAAPAADAAAAPVGDAATAPAAGTEAAAAPAGEAQPAAAVAGAPGAYPTGAAAAAPEPDALEGVDLDTVALSRAIARGKHLVEARYVCVECHGKDFSGGTMIDDPGIGRILGPNITRGKGGRTAKYKAADWDRIVRHGIRPDGTPGAMPAQDFESMSDQELSDVVAYIRSRPPVDNDVPPVTLGPIGTILIATGELPLAADLIKSHDAAHPEAPPGAAPTAEFGKHLAGICVGCHRPGLEGGKITGGAPDWPPAGNLTPHAEGLAGWTFEDFVKLMREGVRRDGTTVKLPMIGILPYAAQMSEVELRAMWAYISTVPPLPDGQ